MQGAGGGGYGAPAERPVEAVVDDVLDGYVTREGAERDYGVAVAADGTVDAAATAQRRAALGTDAPLLLDRGDAVASPTHAYEPADARIRAVP
jgi:hypothetical protein